MRKFLKSLVCVLTAIVIFAFSVVSVPASATDDIIDEITYEQEIMIYFNANSSLYEQGIPYLPNYFQKLSGWNNCKSNWNKFIENSVYPNRFYYTLTLSNGIKRFYIINYDYISYYDNLVTIRFNKCVGMFFYTSFSGSGDSSYECVNGSCFGNYSSSDSFYEFLVNTNYSGFLKSYYQFSINGKSLVLDDGQVLYESLDENKDIGIAQGLGKLLSGGFSLMDNSLVDVNADDFNLLGSLVSGQISTELSSSLGVDVEVGDDTYNAIVTDLTNNTTNSNYWSQIDNSTKTNINNIYSNLKNSFDNSVKVYNNDAGDYYYQPVTTVSSNDNYPNYSTYVSNGGDIADYFNNYIKTNVSNSTGDGGGDVTTGNGGSSSNGDGGAYAEANANAEGGNAEINQGDIVINVPSSSGDGSSSGSSSDSSQDFDDIDISTFEGLIDSCSNFWELLKNIFTIYPAVVWTCLASGITVVVICRLLGR